MNIAVKDSHVPWIGSILSSWEMRKISRSFAFIGSGTTPAVTNSSFHEEGTIPWVNTGDLNDDLVTTPEKCLTERAVQEHSTLRLYPVGTLLVAMYGATIGKVGILGIEACTNQACCALAEPKYFDMRFIYYWFLDNRRNLVTLSYGGGQPNINQDLIRSLKIQTPPIPEQRRIAAYLDEQTEKIDRLMDMRRRQMALLKEQRSALIQQAVTRGLNPNVPMKDSGLPWLGEIPEHWEVKEIRYLVPQDRQVMYGIVLPGPNVDDGVPIVKAGNCEPGRLSIDSMHRTTFEIEAGYVRSRLRAGDIVYAIRGSFGEAEIVPPELEGANLTQDAARIAPRSGGSSGFFMKTV